MNKRGHPETLVAAHPGNTNAVRHGAYSQRIISARAVEIEEEFSGFAFSATQRVAVREVARSMAILEAIDRDLDERGVVDRKGRARAILEHRARVSRRLHEWLAKISTAIDRQTVRAYDQHPFHHDDYIREVKWIALGDDPATSARDRLSALKVLHLLELAKLLQAYEEHMKKDAEKLADYVMEPHLR